MPERRWLRWERIFYITILVLALTSRFVILGARVISHDESIHTKFSWNLYAGLGFQHNPMMHGPSLFEVTALNYHLFGVNDFVARLFPALAGVALVMSPLLFRRWLGRAGSAAAAALLLISPSISYYSRYIRHDVPLMLTAVLLLWSILRYLDEGEGRWLIWMAAFFSLMHTTMEASYIYVAIIVVLLAIPFVVQITRTPWGHPQLGKLLWIIMGVLAVAALIFAVSFLGASTQQQMLDESGSSQVTHVTLPAWGRAAAGAAFCLAFGALLVIYYGIGREKMQQIRLFDVLMVLGTLVLPLGSAFLMRYIVGVDMGALYEAARSGDFSNLPAGMLVPMIAVLVAVIAGSVALGLWWNPKLWPVVALVHYTIFFVAYTTFFTWIFGALSGLVGGLAYWLSQHGVQRGGQPPYYYVFIGSLYEYLPLLGSLIAAVLVAVRSVIRSGDTEGQDKDVSAAPDPAHLLPAFLVGWTALSWAAYSIAGEKMPWLVVHIALPSILLSGWALGQLIERLASERVKALYPIVLCLGLGLAACALGVILLSAAELREALRGGITTAGWQLQQLSPLGRVLGGALGLLVGGAASVWAVWRLGLRSLRWAAICGAAGLAALTVRTMVMANYVNYDLATEFLVYAHGAPDVKVALRQVEDVSWRVTGSPHDVKVAYGEHGSWPLTWYMVDYPNAYFYGTTPDPVTLLDCPVVIAGSVQYAAVEEILQDEYVSFDYIYLWWPIQDYFDLTLQRIGSALWNPELRGALWDIAWRRDYARYAALKSPGSPYSQKTWPYREQFRLYVRRDLALEIWPETLGSTQGVQARPVPTALPDPFAAGEQVLPVLETTLLPGAVIRGVDVAPDGTTYVADTAGHRVWRIEPGSQTITGWGTYGSEPGQFIEPWDVALDSSGNVYVADTWNHRIQKFDSEGRYLLEWGRSGQPAWVGDPDGHGAFYGPRGIAVSSADEVYVTDTGNKRVQVFTTDGVFLREFGGTGTAPGLMNEPVGIAITDAADVLVADTWNRRVQVLTKEGLPKAQWTIPGWDAANPDEKPMLAVAGDQVFVVDPMRQRVLAFDDQGHYRWAISGRAGADLSFPAGVAVIGDVLTIADAHAGRIVRLQMPTVEP